MRRETFQMFTDESQTKARDNKVFEETRESCDNRKHCLPEDVSAEDQAETPRRSWHTSKSNGFYLYVLHTTACSGDGFDRTPVSIQTNFSALRLLFQSVASSPRALHYARRLRVRFGVLHPIDYFQAFTRTILAGRCSFFQLKFSLFWIFLRASTKIVSMVKVYIFRLFIENCQNRIEEFWLPF